MTRNRWHIIREDNTLTVTRALPVRFDVSAETVIADGSRLRLAQQVRQDMWRRLRDLRGFAPVVSVTREGALCRVTAGGRIDGAFPKARAQSILEDMLGDASLRARWSAHAAHREAHCEVSHG